MHHLRDYNEMLRLVSQLAFTTGYLLESTPFKDGLPQTSDNGHNSASFKSNELKFGVTLAEYYPEHNL